MRANRLFVCAIGGGAIGAWITGLPGAIVGAIVGLILSAWVIEKDNGRRIEGDLIELIRQEVERIGCEGFKVEYIPKRNKNVGGWWRVDVHVADTLHWDLGKCGTKVESLEDALYDLRKKRSRIPHNR